MMPPDASIDVKIVRGVSSGWVSWCGLVMRGLWCWGFMAAVRVR
jgi:hypothetical protein